ncbi:MAG: hypothetical protein LC785_02440 [Acidobacteria bacterium]|nr:hypothetical protein [Acidobacteriota bacterium]MCA1640845.1 hypothetical protein [Acidobacteriota bacterium]
MDTAIIVVWWATLLVALVLTAVILKLVFLIVRTERDILQLASTTLAAAQGIVRNTALISELETTRGVAGKILSVAGAIDAGSASIEGKLRSVGGALTGGRS